MILYICIVSNEWLLGVVKPIYKNKGDPLSKIYCPITLLSCLGKLFTCILNSRLEAYAEEVNLNGENQVRFRKAIQRFAITFL